MRCFSPMSLSKQHSTNLKSRCRQNSSNQPPKKGRQHPFKSIQLETQGAGFINKARARCSLTFLQFGIGWNRCQGGANGWLGDVSWVLGVHIPGWKSTFSNRKYIYNMVEFPASYGSLPKSTPSGISDHI